VIRCNEIARLAYSHGVPERIVRRSPQLRRLWDEQLAQQLPAGMLPGYDDAERRFMRVLRGHDLG